MRPEFWKEEATELRGMMKHVEQCRPALSPSEAQPQAEIGPSKEIVPAFVSAAPEGTGPIPESKSEPGPREGLREGLREGSKGGLREAFRKGFKEGLLEGSREGSREGSEKDLEGVLIEGDSEGTRDDLLNEGGEGRLGGRGAAPTPTPAMPAGWSPPAPGSVAGTGLAAAAAAAWGRAVREGRGGGEKAGEKETRLGHAAGTARGSTGSQGGLSSLSTVSRRLTERAAVAHERAVAHSSDIESDAFAESPGFGSVFFVAQLKARRRTRELADGAAAKSKPEI